MDPLAHAADEPAGLALYAVLAVAAVACCLIYYAGVGRIAAVQPGGAPCPAGGSGRS